MWLWYEITWQFIFLYYISNQKNEVIPTNTHHSYSNPPPLSYTPTPTHTPFAQADAQTYWQKLLHTFLQQLHNTAHLLCRYTHTIKCSFVFTFFALVHFWFLIRTLIFWYCYIFNCSFSCSFCNWFPFSSLTLE